MPAKGSTVSVPLENWLYLQVAQDETLIYRHVEHIPPMLIDRVYAECRAKRGLIKHAVTWAEHTESVARQTGTLQPHLRRGAVLARMLAPLAMLYRSRPGYGHWT